MLDALCAGPVRNRVLCTFQNTNIAHAGDVMVPTIGCVHHHKRGGTPFETRRGSIPAMPS